MMLASGVIALYASGADACRDGCMDGRAGDAYKVYSPVPPSNVRMIKQAARLDSFEGKTIAIVGGSFMAKVTHPELKRLILAEYPKAKVYVLGEVGSAGPFPGPGMRSERKVSFENKLKELGVHAVISGNGGCGLCCPKETGNCSVAEHAGLPSVMIAAPAFVEQARRAAAAAGVPVLRVAEYPGAFTAHTRDELIANTRKFLWPQIKKALLTPITEAEQKQSAQFSSASGKAPVFAGGLDEVNAYFVQQGWSDGLPIIPPTKERIEEFLRFTPYTADEQLAVLPVANRAVTTRHVAINGVMAGCKAEHMPVLIAFTKAMGNGYFRRTLSSTHAWNPYCWLNGPLARQLDIDCGAGEISSPVNAAIGRFINLAMRNLGGYYPAINRMGTFGYLMPWCMSEDDVSTYALGWNPYHVQQGFGINENVLTAASALEWGNNMTPATTDASKIMELLAWDATQNEQFALGSGTPFVYRTYVITPSVARNLAAGYLTKEALETALVNTARRPLAERAYANYWANPGSSFTPQTYSVSRHAAKTAHSEHAEETSTPAWLSWCGLKSIQTVPVMQSGKTAIIVTGDADRNKTMCLPGGGYGSVRIELPENWDTLMEAKGYAPLRSFYLTPRKTTTAPERPSFPPRYRRR
ncbi:MAG: hypothetical protein IJN29_14175 [Akkermansia sp.]|nr:hypothetical protein [Akkermansia sp.]